MQADIDAGLLDHVVGDALPAVGVEGRGHHDRRRLGMGTEVEGAPARPFAVELPALAALFRFRVDAGADSFHPLDHLAADADGCDLVAIVHVVEHQHHAAGGEPAEIGIALDQRDRGAFAPGGDGGREAGGPTADDDHVGASDDRGFARIVGDALVSLMLGHACLPINGCWRAANARPAARRRRSRRRTAPRRPSRRALWRRAWPSRNCRWIG